MAAFPSAAELLRRLAVARLADGDEVEDIAASMGVSARSVWRWLARWRAGGAAALATAMRPGRPPKLTPTQETRVLGWIDRSPTAFGFATERWTAPRVAALLEQSLGVRMNHRYLNRWLARRGITPQLPQRVPRERDQARIDAWVSGEWPAIKKKSATATPR
jgi:transposase